MNEREINKILEELISAEPGLKKDGAELNLLLTKLASSKREIEPDKPFMANLKRQLAAKTNRPEKKSNNINSLFNFNNMIKLKFALSALILVLALATGFVYFTQKKSSFPKQIFSSDIQITPLGEKAFGNIALASAEKRSEGGGNASASADALAPKPAMGSDTEVRIVPVGQGGGGTAIYPPQIVYRYVYTGEDFEVPDSSAPMYRRIKGLGSIGASQILRSLNFGIVDLGTFGSLATQQVSLVEDQDFGYAFSINFEEGTMSIFENWRRWLTPNRQCQDQACFDQYRVKISDMPDNASVISITDSFLREHNISTKNLGTPFVQDYWRKEYEALQDKSQIYLPDVVSVIYPLTIEGQEVFDEMGNKSGISVMVNVRLKKVSGVYELSQQNYESSAYNLLTDQKTIISIAEKGGFRPDYYYIQEGAPTTEETVELGTPIRSMVRTWQYNPATQESKELFVPSLIFPVTKGSQNPYYRSNIVVPLVQEILDSALGPQPIPLPAVEKFAQ